MTQIHTERLVINEFTTDDAAFILELVNTPGWLRFIGDKKIYTKEDAQNYIEKVILNSYVKNGFGLYKVCLHGALEAIGMCGLVKRDSLDDADIGFAFLPEYVGKGYAYEAAQAVLQYASLNLLLPRVAAITDHENERSLVLLKKLGMHFQKEIKLPQEETPLLLFATHKSDN